jgi:hypothetical protein
LHALSNEVHCSTRYRVAMLTWFVRIVLLRFLGRRVVPLLIAFDVLRMLLAARRTWMRPRNDR